MAVNVKVRSGVVGEVEPLRVIAHADGSVYLKRTDSMRPGPDLFLEPDEALALAAYLIDAVRAVR